VAKIKIHAGDFRFPQVAQYHSWYGVQVQKPGFWPSSERFPLSALVHLEVASEENVKRLGGTVGWGITGAILLGPVGLLAGLLPGGRGKAVTLVA
jgi:hypothetical protein